MATKASLSIEQETSFGFKAKKLRISQMLTQQELANIAGVSQKEVDLFEKGLPVKLDTKRKLLKELFARKASY
jgi:DNA-binding XRE family transcriptional regulator